MKKLILIFLFIVGYAGYMVFTKIIFGDDNLISVEGTRPILISTELKTVQQKDILYLRFNLKETDKRFTISADVTDVPNQEHIFDGISLALKDAGKVQVGIKRADIASLTPKVCYLKADEQQVFGLIKKSTSNSDLYLLLLLLVLLFCAAYFWLQCLNLQRKTPNYKNKWAF